MPFSDLSGGETALEVDRLRQVAAENEPSINADYLRNLRQTERPGSPDTLQPGSAENATDAKGQQDNPAIPDSVNPRVLIVVLTAFFQQHETLSRTQFLKLIEKR